MTKNLKHIKENTRYVDADNIQEVKLTSTNQINCRFKNDMVWTGEIQKIYLDKKGEAIGYDVYIY